MPIPSLGGSQEKSVLHRNSYVFRASFIFLVIDKTTPPKNSFVPLDNKSTTKQIFYFTLLYFYNNNMVIKLILAVVITALEIQIAAEIGGSDIITIL
jgi:hypothetical protein